MRVLPVDDQQIEDTGVKERMAQAKDGWWKDTNMFGVIGRVPPLLNSIVPVFESFLEVAV